jgi:hypothetical protein
LESKFKTTDSQIAFMDIYDSINFIPPSQSDLLLHDWGYDLIKEYVSIVQQLPQSYSSVIDL